MQPYNDPQSFFLYNVSDHFLKKLPVGNGNLMVFINP